MRAGLHSSGRLWRRARQAFKPHPRNALRCYAAPSAEANVTSSQLVNKSSYTMSAEASPSPSADASPALAAEVETLRKQLAQLEVWCPCTPCISSTQQSRPCIAAWKAQACVVPEGPLPHLLCPLAAVYAGYLETERGRAQAGLPLLAILRQELHRHRAEPSRRRPQPGACAAAWDPVAVQDLALPEVHAAAMRLSSVAHAAY